MVKRSMPAILGSAKMRAQSGLGFPGFIKSKKISTTNKNNRNKRGRGNIAKERPSSSNLSPFFNYEENEDMEMDERSHEDFDFSLSHFASKKDKKEKAKINKSCFYQVMKEMVAEEKIAEKDQRQFMPEVRSHSCWVRDMISKEKRNRVNLVDYIEGKKGEKKIRRKGS